MFDTLDPQLSLPQFVLFLHIFADKLKFMKYHLVVFFSCFLVNFLVHKKKAGIWGSGVQPLEYSGIKNQCDVFHAASELTSTQKKGPHMHGLESCQPI